MKYSKLLVYILSILILMSSALLGSKGEGVSQTGIISSANIGKGLDAEYAQWGKNIGQNSFAMLFYVANNNEKLTLTNVKLSATLNLLPLEIEFNSPAFGNSDTNGDKLIDEIAPGETKYVLVYSPPHSENVSDGELEINILNHNAVQSNHQLIEDVDLFFAKNLYGSFVFSRDQFSFPNWDMSWEDFNGYVSSSDMKAMLYNAKHSFMNQSPGMAAAAGSYFHNPNGRPYTISLPYNWSLDQVVEEDIMAYQFSHMYPTVADAFTDNDPVTEFYRLRSLLEDNKPALITLKSEDGSGQSVVATKLTIFDVSDEVIVEFYNPQPETYLNGEFAVYDKVSRQLNYGGDNYLFRVDEINDLSLPGAKEPIEIFSTRVADLLYDTEQKAFATVSPVNMYVQDSFGRRTGILEDGSRVLEIPGSAFYRVPEDESMVDSLSLVFVPQEETYFVKIRGAGEGFMRFEIYTPKGKDNVEFSYVDSIQVSEVLTVTYDEENASGVSVDNDGDGFTDYIIAPVINDIPTGISENIVAHTITGYQLHQNYPNPFNPSTTISYDVPESDHVTVRIYDIRGGYVKTLVNSIVTAGSHRVIWEGTNSSGAKVNSGVYFYELLTGKTRIVKKLQLIK